MALELVQSNENQGDKAANGGLQDPDEPELPAPPTWRDWVENSIAMLPYTHKSRNFEAITGFNVDDPNKIDALKVKIGNKFDANEGADGRWSTAYIKEFIKFVKLCVKGQYGSDLQLKAKMAKNELFFLEAFDEISLLYLLHQDTLTMTKAERRENQWLKVKEPFEQVKQLQQLMTKVYNHFIGEGGLEINIGFGPKIAFKGQKVVKSAKTGVDYGAGKGKPKLGTDEAKDYVGNKWMVPAQGGKGRVIMKPSNDNPFMDLNNDKSTGVWGRAAVAMAKWLQLDANCQTLLAKFATLPAYAEYMKRLSKDKGKNTGKLKKAHIEFYDAYDYDVYSDNAFAVDYSNPAGIDFNLPAAIDAPYTAPDGYPYAYLAGSTHSSSELLLMALPLALLLCVLCVCFNCVIGAVGAAMGCVLRKHIDDGIGGREYVQVQADCEAEVEV